MWTAVWSLIGGIKGAAIIAVILAIGAWAAVQKISLSKAEAARDQAIVQRDQAGIERDKAITAAQANAVTIKNLEQEKALTNQALNSLRDAQVSNRANNVTREVIIQREAGVPANAAAAAPVLGTIVTEVQADRYRRRGITPPVIAATAANKALLQ